jgi:hypothetical protein
MTSYIQFRSDDTIAQLYERVAGQLDQPVDELLLYLIVDDALRPSLDRHSDSVWMNLRHPDGKFFYVLLSETGSTFQPHSSLVFIMAYCPKVPHPIRFCFQTFLADGDGPDVIWRRFSERLSLPLRTCHRVYRATETAATLCDNAPDFITNGPFFIVEPESWREIPPGFASAEEEEAFEDEEDDDDDDEPKTIVYQSHERPEHVSDFLRYWHERFTVEVISLDHTFHARVGVPEVISVHDFRQFVGERVDFHEATDSLVFFLGDAKEPVRFTRTRLAKSLQAIDPRQARHRLTVACFCGIDENCFAEFRRLALAVDLNGIASPFNVDCIYPSGWRVGDLVGHEWLVPDTATRRLVATQGNEVDGIYRSEVEVGDPAVRNPLRVERVPQDQVRLAQTDKLLPVCYVRREWEAVDNEKEVHPQRYFRVVRGEKFEIARERHVEMAEYYGIPRERLEHASYRLVSREREGRYITLANESLLWELVEDASVMKVVLPGTMQEFQSGYT